MVSFFPCFSSAITRVVQPLLRGFLINKVSLGFAMGFEFRCGVGLGEFVMGRVRGGSEVIIVSPWLSPEVARELVELSKRARVTVITTNDTENRSHVRALGELYTIKATQDEEKRRGTKKLIITGLIMLLLGSGLFAAGLNAVGISLTAGAGPAVSTTGTILIAIGFWSALWGLY
jgi:hypothetical protein